MVLSKRFTYWLVGLTFVFLLLGKLFPPGYYVISHNLLNYEQGFIRRGLFGQFLTLIFPDGMTWQAGYAVALIMTLTASLALLVFVVAGLMRSRSGGPVAIVFVTSIAFVAFIGTVGWLDTVLALLMIAALLLPPNSSGLLGKCLICAAGVLVHENFVAYYAPLLSCEVYLRRTDLAPLKRIGFSFLPVATSVAAMVAVFSIGNIPWQDHARIYEYFLARALNFEFQQRALEVITTTPDGTSKMVDPTVATLGNWLATLSLSLFGLPYLFLLARLLYKLIGDRTALEKLAIAGAIVAPLSLYVAAFDVSRFIGTAIINLFVLLAYFCRTDAQVRQNLATVFDARWIMVFLCLNFGIALREYSSISTYLYRLPASLILQSNWLTPPEQKANQDLGKIRSRHRELGTAPGSST